MENDSTASDLGFRAISDALSTRFGRPLRYLARVESTNTAALEWAAAGAPEGALVVADHQVGGRGRWGRGWFAAPGASLTFSVVLRPRLALERIGLVTTAMGLAVAEGIERVAPIPIALKWPNDVVIGERKLAGILVETRIVESRADAVVAGVGINCAAFPRNVPQGVSENATTIADELAQRGLRGLPTRAEVLAAVLASFESIYASLTEPAGAVRVVERAAQRSNVLGRTVDIGFANGSRANGRATRLLPSGALEVEFNGSLRILETGEIRQLRPQ